MTKPKLLPCPFCGGQGHLRYRGSEGVYKWYVYCIGCDARGKLCIVIDNCEKIMPYEKAQILAVSSWNKRIKPQETAS